MNGGGVFQFQGGKLNTKKKLPNNNLTTNVAKSQAREDFYGAGGMSIPGNAQSSQQYSNAGRGAANQLGGILKQANIGGAPGGLNLGNGGQFGAFGSNQIFTNGIGST